MRVIIPIAQILGGVPQRWPIVAHTREQQPQGGQAQAHHGMVIVPIGYATPELFDVSQVGGGTPYGASTIAGGDGSRQPDERELAITRFQGKYVAEVAVKLKG